MTLIDDDQIEEVRRELVIDGFSRLAADDRLIERQIDLERSVDAPRILVNQAPIELGHRVAERRKVIDARLIHQDVSVGEEEDPLGRPGLPKPPHDVERCVGLAGPGCHGEKDSLLALGDCVNRPVDGDLLVVARLLA